MQTVYKQLKQKGSAARIAVMRYRFIGDTLLTVPFLKALRQALPKAHIEVLVAPNSGEVLEECPHIDKLIYWDTTRKHRYEIPTQSNDKIETQKPQNFFQSVKLLRQGNYDAVFVLKRSFSSALMARFAGIRLRIGFDTEQRGFLLTHRVPYSLTAPEAECYLQTLKNAGFPSHCFDEKPELSIWLTTDEKEKAQLAFEPFQNKTNILLHLTSSNAAKQWPDKNTKELLSWLLSHPDYHVHFLGAPGDKLLYENLVQSCPDTDMQRLHNWCGQWNIRESAAFLSHLTLAVGVDSGTMHLARAVNIPTIVLFGPMNENKWTPPGAKALTHPIACHPCNLKIPCHQNFSCIRDLQPSKVIDAIQRQLSLITV